MSLAMKKDWNYFDIPLSPCELSSIRGPGLVRDVSSDTAKLPRGAVEVEPAAW
jgi:hypothetical protein